MSVRLTVAQALVHWLDQQWVERDGTLHKFFAGCFGIFGHGNVAGVGQALHQYGALRYIDARNEQGMVHAAAAYARQKRRLATFACTSSIGPGATNMVTAAASATINRVPVLLLPGDIFARRNVGPVLQQLDTHRSPEVSVNDCFRPVSRFWDRINRPDQLAYSLEGAMQVLTSPANTGTATICLPQDVQTEAHEYPTELFRRRVWHIPRPRPDHAAVARAAQRIRSSERPLIIVGGGVVYSHAEEVLDAFVQATGIPVAETQAGKGALPHDHRCLLGAIGVTGSSAANCYARDADLVIGIGTRYTDFTTASTTLFSDAEFVSINVAEPEAAKFAGYAVVADARAALEDLTASLRGWSVPAAVLTATAQLRRDWTHEVDRLLGMDDGPPVAQSAVIGVVNSHCADNGVVICAAGSMPGDLHKLWRATDPSNYHVEYGYSCMGYEVAAGLGVTLAQPDRSVVVLVGDGSYLMLAQEIVTAVKHRIRFTVVLVDNHGFASIGGLSEAVGAGKLGTDLRNAYGEPLPIDFVQNAQSMGAHAVEVDSLDELGEELERAENRNMTTVIVVKTDPELCVPTYDAWWDVPPASVAEGDADRAIVDAWQVRRDDEREMP